MLHFYFELFVVIYLTHAASKLVVYSFPTVRIEKSLHLQHDLEELPKLTPKALWWPKNGLCCFGQVPVIRRCDMIFWEFSGK
jgi:hypothetical protein